MHNSVFITRLKPDSVVKDYLHLFSSLPKPKNTPTIVKLNLSWSKFYPAVSTPPWHFQAVLQWLVDSGVSPQNIFPVENRTVVTDVQLGATNHGWPQVAKQFGVKIHYLTQEPYVAYRPKAKMLVLDQIFPEGILLPKIIFGKPLVSLCTLKSHVFTTVTGSIKNYFGMLNTNRHYCHRFIHEAIIDLLQIQKELHPSLYATADGSVVGYGSGPRAMDWKPANLALASCDEVALDATAARIIGFKPKSIKFLQLAQNLNLGDIDPKIVGLPQLPLLHVGHKADTLASKGQKLIYGHFPKWLEDLLLHTLITPWSYAASTLYHDYYWYHFVGQPRLKRYQSSPWGALLQAYLYA